MPEIEKEDLNDGCKCPIVEVWTPAAMILMRVMESGLRSYYQNITSNEPSGKNWGAIIDELKSNNSVDKKLLSYFSPLSILSLASIRDLRTSKLNSSTL